jgi:hypothetical protein
LETGGLRREGIMPFLLFLAVLKKRRRRRH